MRVTCTSNKGGVGKTTSAIHLAAYLAGKGETVLVDLDPNGSALAWAERAVEGGRPLPFAVEPPADDEPDVEHVVYDSPGRLYGEELETVVELSDLILAPTMPNRLSVDVLAGFAGDLADLGSAVNLRVLLTAVPWWNTRGKQAREDLEGAGVPLLRRSVRFRPAFDSAADAGLLVQDVGTRGGRQGWEDYKAVGRELMLLAREVRTW